ncbi:MAG: hypothetical protein H6624_00385 [Bdellovibrionaceae bacterium]|nr:hypothetical protein [Bdellovibrionales bacterium]MCB9082764.1 hypothetical protein [Pseudobdellovibrionaceae bacterium]
MGKLLGRLNVIVVVWMWLSSCSDPRLVAGPKPIPQKTTAVYIKNYCPTDGYRFTEIFSFNSSSQLKIEAYEHLYYHISDYDRDGLSDEFEKEQDVIDTFNIGWGLWDTNGDGYSDFLMYAIGYDKDNQVRLSSCAQATQDTDDDGLPDCAEDVLRTDYTKPDSDNDGVPDGIEYRFGTNPSDPMDVITDYDQDGLTVMQELKANLPHRFTNNELINSKAYKYDVETFYNGSQDCYNVRISNIPVMDVSNGNLIHVMAVENNTIPGQGDITRISTLKVLIPRGIQDKSRAVIDNGIQGQVVDGVNIPLVLEDDTEEPI